MTTRWKLKVGDSTDVVLTVDQNAPILSTAKMVDAHGMLVPLANTDPVVDAMRDGSVLTVATDLGKFSFKLTGAGPAIADLAGCVTEHLEAEKLLGRKTETAAPANDGANKLFTENEALAFVSHLLASAGITNYQLVDPAENPMPNFDVVWTYDNGIVAALVGYKNMSGVDLDEATRVVIADDAKNCDGDFSSGKKVSEPAETVSVKRLFTACHTDGDDHRDPLHSGEDRERASHPDRPSQSRRGDRRRRHRRSRLPAYRGAAKLQIIPALPR